MQTPTTTKAGSRTKGLFWFYCLLAVATAAVYLQVVDNDFINYDDKEYVYDNVQVKKGITRETIKWAFTSTVAANWHPVTMLSHLLDVQLFGLNPGGHHATSLLFHILNTLMLFHILSRMTGSRWPSIFTALLFALHPLHVESVAWIAERKDVLSTFFWMLTTLQYIRYVEKPSNTRYITTLIFFIMGLMAKPMLVTLPCTLLLFDFWPLSRYRWPSKGTQFSSNDAQKIMKILIEKIPFFLIVVLFCGIAYIVQKTDGAVAELGLIPFQYRVYNALVSYGVYIVKMFWPFNLAIFYPFPWSIPLWKPILSLFGLTLATIIALRGSKNFQWLIVGWLWYLGTLVPVIGLVQIGSQAMADRYTYIPLIGLFIAIAWQTEWLFHHLQLRKATILSLGAVYLIIVSVLTWQQLRYWRNNISLYQQAIRATGGSSMVYGNIGSAYLDHRQYRKAAYHFLAATHLKPDNAKAYNNLGITLMREGRLEMAVTAFKYALETHPNYVSAHINLGVAFIKLGKLHEGSDHFRKALQLNPPNPKLHFNIGLALEKQNRLQEALFHYREALRYDPGMFQASKRVAALQKKGQSAER